MADATYIHHLRLLIDAAKAKKPKTAWAWARQFGCHAVTVKRMAKLSGLDAAILPTPAPTAPPSGTVPMVRYKAKGSDRLGQYASIGQKVLRAANLLGHKNLHYNVIHDGAILITAPDPEPTTGKAVRP